MWQAEQASEPASLDLPQYYVNRFPRPPVIAYMSPKFFPRGKTTVYFWIFTLFRLFKSAKFMYGKESESPGSPDLRVF